MHTADPHRPHHRAALSRPRHHRAARLPAHPAAALRRRRRRRDPGQPRRARGARARRHRPRAAHRAHPGARRRVVLPAVPHASTPFAAGGIAAFGLVNAVAILVSAAFLATALEVALDPARRRGAATRPAAVPRQRQPVGRRRRCSSGCGSSRWAGCVLRSRLDARGRSAGSSSAAASATCSARSSRTLVPEADAARRRADRPAPRRRVLDDRLPARPRRPPARTPPRPSGRSRRRVAEVTRGVVCIPPVLSHTLSTYQRYVSVRQEQPMTWKSFHRRGEILRTVIATADARRDGLLPMDVAGRRRDLRRRADPARRPPAALAHPARRPHRARADEPADGPRGGGRRPPGTRTADELPGVRADPRPLPRRAARRGDGRGAWPSRPPRSAPCSP